MTGEAVARAVNDDALTVAYRLAPLRRMGYVQHAGHDRYGRVLWKSTSRGDALFQAMRH